MIGTIRTQNPAWRTSGQAYLVYDMQSVLHAETAKIGYYIRQINGQYTVCPNGPGDEILEVTRVIDDPSAIQPPAADLAAWMIDEGGLVWAAATIARRVRPDDDDQLISGHPELPSGGGS